MGCLRVLLARLPLRFEHSISAVKPRDEVLALGLPFAFAIAVSAVLFAFDPFMMATFKHLHWIAVWDGLVWGLLWVRLRNLYATIVAHAVEGILLYSVVRIVLS